MQLPASALQWVFVRSVQSAVRLCSAHGSGAAVRNAPEEKHLRGFGWMQWQCCCCGKEEVASLEMMGRGRSDEVLGGERKPTKEGRIRV